MPQSSVFVARGIEISRLNALFQKTLAGQGQICLITGNAGSGKTALMGAFTRQALTQNKKVIVAIGMADATTGAGDAYLPFREILAQLTGDVDAKLSQGAITSENAQRLRKLLGLSGEAIAELGPDLIGIFIPGVGLLARAAAFAVDKSGWLDKLTKNTEKASQVRKASQFEIAQGNIFEQYTNVLRKLAEKHPLVLVVDDLHWADAASCELIFHLARRIQGYPILILGAYRPDEVALGRQGERHPLEKVINELKRYYGDIQIELDQVQVSEARTFVDAFIDSEPNVLGNNFRLPLFKLTNGHPLFTIELLRNMQEQGDLIRDATGRWITGPVLNWDDLPKRVEGVIEERLDRLVEELRQVLTIGSVEGESFTAEIIASVQKADVRSLIRSLSGDLEKKHCLVAAQGIQSLNTGRISLYRFQHNLFQRYLYNELDDVERSYLHEDVGRVMEELFTGETQQVAVQLAHHFSRAGLPEKALPYLYSAGEQAAAHYANQEALGYFSRALELAPKDDVSLQFKLHMGREQIFNLLGERQQQKQELDILNHLCAVMEDQVKQSEVALHSGGYMESIGDYPQAIATVERSVKFAQAASNIECEARAYHKWGYILWKQGNYQEALVQLEQALDLARAGGVEAVEAGALREMGVILWRQGDYPKSEACFQQALSIYTRLGDRRGEGRVLSGLGNLYLGQDKYKEAEDHYMQALKVDLQAGDKRGEIGNLGNLGIIAALKGNIPQALTRFNQILKIAQEINDRESEARALGNLASSMMDPGYYSEAEKDFTQALEIFQSIGNQSGCCWILTDRALINLHLNRLEKATEDCNAAFAIAQKIGNKHFQNTAITHRAHVELKQGKLEEAKEDYQSCLRINVEMGDLPGQLEALAGLANLAQIVGELDHALVYVEQIWEKFDPSQVRVPESRSSILLTCFLIFEKAGDKRSKLALQRAYELIMQQADKFEDENFRHSFLENVFSNRQVCALVESGALDR